MALCPKDNVGYLCPSTQDQLQRFSATVNSVKKSVRRPLGEDDPSNARFIRRQRKLRETQKSAPPSVPSNLSKFHPVDDGVMTRWKKILHKASAVLTIQPSSEEDAAFLTGLLGDADKCLNYPEWFEKYKTELFNRFVVGNGECDDDIRLEIANIFNKISLRCHLEALAPLFQQNHVPSRWHVPDSLSVLSRPMTRQHMALALCFEWNGKANPMKLRKCEGWHGDCLLGNKYGRPPFELPPYRMLTDYLEGNDSVEYDVRWHWGRPMCLVCRLQSIHFPLLTREGCEVKGGDFSMYHDLDFVDVRPEYKVRIPRPCTEAESGVAIQTHTLLVLAFSEALQLTERGYDVSHVCT